MSMTSTLLTEASHLPPPNHVDWGGGENQYSSDARPEWTLPRRTYLTGMVLATVAIVMFFTALLSALVVRRGFSTDWVTVPWPSWLWLNTALLLVSSGALELSHHALSHRRTAAFTRWLFLTAYLGAAFLAGQLAAWQELAARGFYLPTNPASAFFYLLTAAHGVHLIAGVAALFYVLFRAGRVNRGIDQPTALDLTRIYWHFLTALWLVIFFMLRG